jgi:hypothetical protein
MADLAITEYQTVEKVIEKLNCYALLSPETSLVASISVRRQFRIIQSLVWSQVSLLDDKDQD